MPTPNRPSDGTSWVHEIDDFDLESFLAVAQRFGSERYGYVVTPNVDHLLRLREDAAFRSYYDAAEFVLLDSRFLAYLLGLTQGMRLGVCTGSDLTQALLARVVQPCDRVVLLGGTPEQARRLEATFGLRNLRHFNPPMGFIRDPAAVEECLTFIERSSPFRFCFLAVGSPQQEALAHQLRARAKARGLVLCIGASVDFITGVEKRAPRWMQRLALEWLHRLAQNPRRLAHRYLIRGPRIFAYLRRARIVLRAAPHAERPAGELAERA